MKHFRLSNISFAALMTLTFVFLSGSVRADEYQDVNQLVRNGKLSEALSKADQYLSNKPKDAQMRFLKGVIQRDAGKTSDAIGTFTRLTEDYPELPEPYNNLAVLYAGQSQFDKARTALEMSIRTNPSYSTAHENLGDVYAKLASQAYNKALQLDASNPAVAPKLALIRELFNPNAKGQRPTAPSGVTAQTAVTALPKPAPTLPTPVAAKPAEVKPAPATPSASVAVATAPVAVASTVAPVVNKPAATPTPAPVASNAGAKEAEAAVRAWAKAWANKDMGGYLGTYAKSFDTPGNMSRAKWEEERRNRITGKASISVKLDNLNVTVNGNKATVRFRQDYRAGGLSVSSRKVLEMVKNGDRWQIVRESTAG
jgi:tetratricopeptide (TPR) repeat protein